jgi:uncharacterized protein YbjQ (UPF0145 family)
MFISGLSGNEVFCLAQKGYRAGDLAVGNSVRSLGFAGAVGSQLQTLAGGEIGNITQLISEGRHAAISRMEEEARRHGAAGITGVTSELATLSGYVEFLSQGTSVLVDTPQGQPFTTSASGVDLYCHLDAGYRPMKFVMGNVAYALGIGRGLTGGLRTMAKGEVKEYSEMYNRIRHLALWRLKEEAAAVGANAVVDVNVEILPFGPGVVELLMTGTAAHHPRFSQGPVTADKVVTSELTGTELWNMAHLGWAPVELVMATSVYSIGIAGGIGTFLSGMAKGELNDLTRMVYEARENCLELVRQEAKRLGAEQVIGNKLRIRELSPGLIEIIAVGTAIRRSEGVQPSSPTLLPQAMMVEPDALRVGGAGMAGVMPSIEMGQAMRQRANPIGCIVAALFFGLIMLGSILSAVLGAKGHRLGGITGRGEDGKDG